MGSFIKKAEIIKDIDKARNLVSTAFGILNLDDYINVDTVSIGYCNSNYPTFQKKNENYKGYIDFFDHSTGFSYRWDSVNFKFDIFDSYNYFKLIDLIDIGEDINYLRLDYINEKLIYRSGNDFVKFDIQTKTVDRRYSLLSNTDIYSEFVYNPNNDTVYWFSAGQTLSSYNFTTDIHTASLRTYTDDSVSAGDIDVSKVSAWIDTSTYNNIIFVSTDNQDATTTNFLIRYKIDINQLSYVAAQTHFDMRPIGVINGSLRIFGRTSSIANKYIYIDMDTDPYVNSGTDILSHYSYIGSNLTNCKFRCFDNLHPVDENYIYVPASQSAYFIVKYATAGQAIAYMNFNVGSYSPFTINFSKKFDELFTDKFQMCTNNGYIYENYYTFETSGETLLYLEQQNQYDSPILIECEGKTQYIFIGNNGDGSDFAEPLLNKKLLKFPSGIKMKVLGGNSNFYLECLVATK